MKRAFTVISLAAAAGAALFTQTTKPAIAEDGTSITLIATVCMKTFVHGERREICGDFRLKPEGIALTIKRAQSRDCEKQLGEQLQEDVVYYEQQNTCRTLVGFIYDPEGFFREPAQLEFMWSKPQDRLELRCVIAG